MHASNASTAPAGTGQFVFNTAKSLLLWDADGAGGSAAAKVAKLAGVSGLAASDFEIIA